MAERERLLQQERLLMERIRELDAEELNVEIVDSSSSDEDDSIRPSSGHGEEGSSPFGVLTFDTALASLHTYLGDVDDIHGRLVFLDGGAVLSLPMFYLEGVVLFPESTLPLRVVQPSFRAAFERALNQVDAPFTIGVVRVYWSRDGRLHVAKTGTTAEIRQYKRLDDGSINVLARGQQRFRLQRHWIDADGAPCAEVQIVQEDPPLRTPKAAFAQLASVCSSHRHSSIHTMPLQVSSSKQDCYDDSENEWEFTSPISLTSDLSAADMRTACDSPIRSEDFDVSSSEEEFRSEYGKRSHEPHSSRSGASRESLKSEALLSEKQTKGGKSLQRAGDKLDGLNNAPLAFWPHWIYKMYDSYVLAHTVAELWKQIIRTPNMDDFRRKPDILSFSVASRLPVSESTRQELLDMDGVSYRLQREMQLLKTFNLLRCKNCLSVIAKRSDMLVMSSDGPLNAYVNPHGYMHEVITVYHASGLALRGAPETAHSWFPGYAWTIIICAGCEDHMGWLFTAAKKNLVPKSFWGIRSSQIADSTK